MRQDSDSFPQIDLMARSLFALFLVMTLSGVVGLPVMLLSAGDAAALGGYVAALLAAFAVCAWLYRAGEEAALRETRRVLVPPRDKIAVGMLGAAVIMTALAALYAILESGSARLNTFGAVMLVWCVCWLILLSAMYWNGLKRVTQPVLIGLGIVLLALIAAEGVLRLLDAISPEQVRIADVDTRPQTWTTITDTEVPWAEQYWLEYGYASREFTWTPYVYWRMSPYDGDYVNVDARGIRYTTPPDDEPEMSIHMYGGSTMWGHGARDEHTIPSELVRAMDEHGITADVTNFGELGYIARQDATLFELQLSSGSVPDVAVFYWGFNDVYITYNEHYIGLTGSEKDRGAQFAGTQCVLDLSTPVVLNSLLYKTRVGERILRALDVSPPNPAEGCAMGTADWEGINTGLVAPQTDDPAVLAAYIAHEVRVVQSLGDLYGVQVVVIWQPAIFQKNPLSWYEQQIVNLERWRVFGEYYNAVDGEVRAALAAQENVLIWTDFFQDIDANINIFIDKVHITEEGNALVADEIADYLIQTDTARTANP